MIIIGNLNKIITIQRLYTERNDYGEVIEKYQNYLTLKASIKKNGGGYEVNNYEKFHSELISFITYYRDIIETDRIIYNGNVYYIKTINEINNKNGLELVCFRGNE